MSKPEANKTILAIICALLQAKRLVNAAKVLHKNDFPELAASKLVLGFEELGKIKPLGQLFLQQVGKNKPNRIPKPFKKTFYNHELKLSLLLSFLATILNKESSSIKISSDDESTIDKLRSLISSLESGEMAKSLNEFKKKGIYTELTENTVECPLHGMERANIHNLEMGLDYLYKIISGIDFLLEEFFPQLYSKIKEFHSSKGAPPKDLEVEVRRLLTRFMPAARKIIDDMYLDQFGSRIMDDPKRKERKKLFKPSENFNIKEFLEKHEALYTTEEELSSIYFS